MSNKLIVWILVIIVVIGAIVLLTRGDEPEIENGDNEGESVTVTLSAQSNSGQDGTATLTEVDGQIRVEIEIDEATSTLGLATSTVGATTTPAVQPAHIHVGSCPTPGAVVYNLNDVVEGRSETMISATLAQLRSELPLAINVHQSPSQLAVYVSCGNVELE